MEIQAFSLLSQVGWVVVGGGNENKANSAQLELELGLSLAIIVATMFCLQRPRAAHATHSDQLDKWGFF